MGILLTLSIIPVILKLLLGNIDENKRNKKVYYILCGLAIFLVMGLRDRYTGSRDTEMYSMLLEGFPSGISIGDYLKSFNEDNVFFLFAEYGFYIMVWILGQLNFGPQGLILISSLIICLCTMIFLYRHSTDSFLSILMFICLGSFTFAMNGMRQTIAMSICLLSYVFVEKRKIVPFILTVLVATLFHKTAIFFTAVYIFSFLKPKLSHIVIFTASLVLFYLLSDSLIEIFDEIVDKDYSEAESFDGGGIVTVLLYLSSILLFFMANKKNKAEVLPIILLVIVGLYLYIFRYFSIQIFERMSYYFYYFILLLIPKEISILEEKERKIIYLLFVLFCVALFAYRLPNGAFADFKFFW